MTKSVKWIEYTAIMLLVVGFVALIAAVLVFFWHQGGINMKMQANTSLLSSLGSFLSGTVGITWSLASVILFYLALQEQRNDVLTNQKALNQQIEEMKETKIVYLQQSDILRTQTFENTFFQLIQLHSSTVKDFLHLTNEGAVEVTGKRVFGIWKKELNMIANGYIPEPIYDIYGGVIAQEPIPFQVTPVDQEALILAYRTSYKNFEDVLSQYFRQLYHIFKYVHLTQLISDDRKPFYASLVRAQLSQSELCALVFNSFIDGHGKPKFLFLMKKYHLIKNLDVSNIPQPIVWSLFNSEIDAVSDPFE